MTTPAYNPIGQTAPQQPAWRSPFLPPGATNMMQAAHPGWWNILQSAGLGGGTPAPSGQPPAYGQFTPPSWLNHQTTNWNPANPQYTPIAYPQGLTGMNMMARK